MKYLLDTDWLIDFLVGERDTQNTLLSLAHEGFAISIVSFTELYEGIYTSSDPKQAEQGFRNFLRSTAVLPFSRTVAKRTAQIRGDLRRRKHPITHRALDLIIAATALTYNLMLLTRNIKDYDDIPDLSLY